MRVVHCLCLLCVLVFTGCATTKNSPKESTIMTGSTKEVPLTNSGNYLTECKDRMESYIRDGYTYLTKEQYESTLEAARQSGTIVSFEELDERYIGKTCVVASKSGENALFGSACPPGFISLYIDSTYNFCKVYRGELYRIGGASIGIKVPGKRGGASKKDIQSIIILDDNQGTHRIMEETSI